MTDVSSLAPAAEPRPILPALARDRLGHKLAEVYAESTGGTALDEGRFATLIARLERVFGELDGQDDRTFRAEFLAMMPRLHRFAMSLTKDPALADDLVQDTLMRGWRSRARFEAGTNLGAWLFTIMRNAFYSLHRKNAREVSDSDGALAERLAAVPEQPGHVDLGDARSALAALPNPMREALILVAIENLSYEEAALAMNCRIGTVKSRVWRAREQLAHILGYDAAEVGADGMTLSVVGGLNGAPARS